MHRRHLLPRARALWHAALAGGLLLLLAACSTMTGPPASSGADDHAYVLSVQIPADAERAAIEARYGGDAVVWRPEAGFAVLGLPESELTLQLDGIEANTDAISTPEATASGWTAWAGGWTAWAGGWTAWAGGWTAWAGGWTAWAGGWTAWAGGWTAWAGGSDTPQAGTFLENLDVWEQTRIPAAQLRSPALGAGVKVAVIDTGVDVDHPAFAGKLAPASEWYDFVDGDADPDEVSGGAYGHGTAVAGIVLQVAPGATILPIRALNPGGSGDLTWVVSAIDHAVAHGADILNLSLGAHANSATLQAMVDYAAAQGAILIASAGNEGVGQATYPARWSLDWGARGSQLLSVGSVGDGDVVSGFSNRGLGLELFAPGEAIATLAPDNQVALWSGTSFAAPLASGVLALAAGERLASGQSLAGLAPLAAGSTDAIDLANPGLVGLLGNGRLDADALLNALGSPLPSPGKTAVMVVGNPSSLSDFDAWARDRLTLSGYQVTLHDDGSVSASTLAAADLALISQSVSSGTVMDSLPNLADLAVPLIVWEDGIFDDLGLASSADDPVDGSIRVEGNHPLTAGLAGDVPVYHSDDRIAHAQAGPGAVVAATLDGDPAKATIFGYDAGATMIGRSAPAPRVGFFVQSYDDRLTWQGRALFDAAVRWAAFPREALLVAGSTSLNGGDQAAKARLEQLGYGVTVVGASASQAADADGKQLVLISSTVNSGDVNTRFRDVAVPVLVWEGWLYDDMGMTDGSGYGSSHATTVTISDPAHPLAANLTGTPTVFGSSDEMNWGSPTSNAAVVASDGSGNARVFGYDTDASMVGLSAPARRVGIQVRNNGPALLTADGWKLFDAAVAWAVSGGGL